MQSTCSPDEGYGKCQGWGERVPESRRYRCLPETMEGLSTPRAPTISSAALTVARCRLAT